MNRDPLFADVLSEELHAIDMRRACALFGRDEVLAEGETEPDLQLVETPAPSGETPEERQKREDHDSARFDREMRKAALDRDLVGLAFSGGGIRSATFSLGILQGLGRMKLLRRIDYLSTVSGGGYIGSWLAAWIRREGTRAEPPDPASPGDGATVPDAMENVELQLNPSRIEQSNARRPVFEERSIVDEEPEAIRHLRSYSNYLTPRPGLFTTDTWTLLGIYIRNFLLNQLILFPLTVAFVVLVWIVVLFFGPHRWGSGKWCGFFFLALLAWSFTLLGLELSKLYRARTQFSKEPPRLMQWFAKAYGARWLVRSLGSGAFQLLVILPLFIAAVVAVWLFGVYPNGDFHWRAAAELVNQFKEEKVSVPGGIVQDWTVDGNFSVTQAAVFAIGFGLLHFAAHLFGMSSGLALDFARLKGFEEWTTRLRRDVLVLLASLASGAFGGFLFYLFMIWYLIPFSNDAGALATFGPPLAVLLFTAAVYLEVGLLGRFLAEDEREWWATVTSLLLTKAAVWLVVLGTIVYVPWLVLRLNQWAQITLTPALVMGWVATSLGAALAGRTGEPNQTQKGSGWILGLFLKAAPVVFLIGLLSGVSWMVWRIVFESLSVPMKLSWFTEAIERDLVTLPALVAAFLSCLLVAAAANILINVNLFSLHSMYANRLTRCYLGASRRKEEWTTTWRNGVWNPGTGGAPTGSGGKLRSGQLLTGFDFHDDLPLRDLRIGSRPDSNSRPSTADNGYWGPFRLINTAMNLVKGQELAVQDRKAESFVLSPLYCGSKGTGYRKLGQDSDEILTLGRAMAISGAAADPSVGAKQSGALTALLTIFNARLGWWIENPKTTKNWTARSPRFAGLLWYELAGLSDENGSYVHLSDGGHFENLGVYELIRRRCRYIIVCDAGQDRKSIYDDLATLTRLCRSDFGVRITIDTGPIDPANETLRGRWHCAIGQIHYEDVDPGEVPGLLIYIKASLTGDEPSDVRNYAATHPDFPHQTTADQFFDEAQFESYRALGHHIASTVFNPVAYDGPGVVEKTQDEGDVRQGFKQNNRELFSRLRSHWFPAPPGIEATYEETAQAFGILQGVMRSDGTLRAFSRDMNPELGRADAGVQGGGDHVGIAPSAEEERANRRSAELHMVNQVVQVMEKAWRGVRLEGYPEHPINRGWMNALRRVSRSKTLQRNWPIVRGGFDQEFVQFLERELGLPDGSPTPFPLSRNAAGVYVIVMDSGDKIVGGSVRLLGKEFAREWPKEQALEDLIGQAQTLKMADETPASWLIFSTRYDTGSGQLRPTFPIGLVMVRPWEPEDLELIVWLRGPYRSMGIGRDCLAASSSGHGLLDRIINDLGPKPGEAKKRLVARFPKTKPGCRAIERKLWLNFHYAYEFRAKGSVDVDSGSELLMYRWLRPPEVDFDQPPAAQSDQTPETEQVMASEEA
ncbi:patatin-like phospholipase family protein [Paludisphaera borealis]|uniref:Patatin-like phospholipase n=1 Tax=Paludisphaera borealis TaxID=1387353 RepID=A0A1U7CLA4_9BACT|nr:patatin-like phospholipase family protein [Paludisphaera borealis]APW59720.1 Patatin-like phospholipase [Paludisphaera borealis]